MAQAAGDTGVVMSRALRPLGLAQVLLGDQANGLATLHEARRTALEARDTYEVALAMCTLAEALLYSGQLREATNEAAAAEEYATDHGHGSRFGKVANYYLAIVQRELGQWHAAYSTLDRRQRYPLTEDDERERQRALLQLDTRLGDFDSAGRRATRLSSPSNPFWDWELSSALAEFALWTGDPQAAVVVLRPDLDNVDGHPDIPPQFFYYAMVLGIRAEVDVANRNRARDPDADLDESLANARRVLDLITRSVLSSSTAHPDPRRERALIAMAEAEFGRFSEIQDPDRWVEVVELWRDRCRPYETAYALLREGEAVLSARRDRPRAAACLGEARRIALDLGARPLREAVEQLAARAAIAFHEPGSTIYPEVRDDTARHPQGAYGKRRRSDLTRREREVLALLVAGHPDGEIAEQLFIAKKTASVHVARIKAKLASRSRVAIATDAIGLGLVDPPQVPSVRPE